MDQQQTTEPAVSGMPPASPVDLAKCQHPKAALLLAIAEKCQQRHSALPLLRALDDVAYCPLDTIRARKLPDGSNAKFVAGCLDNPASNLGELMAALGIYKSDAQELFCEHGPTMQGAEMASRLRRLAEKGTLVRVSRRR